MIGSAEGSQQEGREYGSISYNVYWQYLKAGGLTLLAMFIGLSVSLQTLKVYLDYLLRWSSTLNPWFNFTQTFRDLVGSPSAGDVSSFFHVFGSLSFVVILVTYFYNILGQVAKKILLYFKIVVAVTNIPYFQWIGANARENLHEKMLRNLFLCPIELFESYPIGRSFASPS